jgi:excisionase family DNA binding protein
MTLKMKTSKTQRAENVTEAMTAGRLLEPGELAGLVSFHPESVRRAIRQGRIRALKFGNSWRIPSAEVARIITQGLSGPTESVNE